MFQFPFLPRLQVIENTISPFTSYPPSTPISTNHQKLHTTQTTSNNTSITTYPTMAPATTMALRRSALLTQRLTHNPFALSISRPFSTTPVHNTAGDQPKHSNLYTAPPPSTNMPPNSVKAGKKSSPSEDSQSSASTAPDTSSDDHPAKQPDPQAEVTRSTGFGNVEGGVKGGKAGLGERSDRDSEGN
jgi:hypothetical protein